MTWRSGPAYWRCLNTLECKPAREGRTFRGPTQNEVQQTDTMLPCPECGSKRIMFVRNAVVTASEEKAHA